MGRVAGTEENQIFTGNHLIMLHTMMDENGDGRVSKTEVVKFADIARGLHIQEQMRSSDAAHPSPETQCSVMCEYQDLQFRKIEKDLNGCITSSEFLHHEV